jgi:pimeloyl-ACP methyl ester carboxylesterase
MSLPRIVSQAEWKTARNSLLVKEKEATRALDALAAERRRLPMLLVDTPSAFSRLNEDLLPTVRSRSRMIPTLKKFERPVRIIFGDTDPCLNTGVAKSFHQLFPTSELFLVPGARHYVQMDEPDEVARLILSLPLASNE